MVRIKLNRYKIREFRDKSSLHFLLIDVVIAFFLWLVVMIVMFLVPVLKQELLNQLKQNYYVIIPTMIATFTFLLGFYFNAFSYAITNIKKDTTIKWLNENPAFKDFEKLCIRTMKIQIFFIFILVWMLFFKIIISSLIGSIIFSLILMIMMAIIYRMYDSLFTIIRFTLK